MRVDLAHRPQRPLCLLDIDGVIALLGPGSEPTVDLVAAGLPVKVSQNARERVSRLAAAFQVVWASAWMRDGAEELGPLVGLPSDLPFLRFDVDAHEGIGSYKLGEVQRFVRDRAVAWVDDELAEDVVAWAKQREHPTKLIHCDPRLGLTDAHVEDLVTFASDNSTDQA